MHTGKQKQNECFLPSLARQSPHKAFYWFIECGFQMPKTVCQSVAWFKRCKMMKSVTVGRSTWENSHIQRKLARPSASLVISQTRNPYPLICASLTVEFTGLVTCVSDWTFSRWSTIADRPWPWAWRWSPESALRNTPALSESWAPPIARSVELWPINGTSCTDHQWRFMIWRGSHW